MKKLSLLAFGTISMLTLNAQPPQDRNLVMDENVQDHGAVMIPVPSPEIHTYSSLPANGLVTVQLNNRPLFSTQMKSNKLHGNWQSWYQTGISCDSGTLVKGLPHGVWKHWDASGRLKSLRTYNADKYQRISNDMTRFHPKRISFPLVVLYQKNKQAALKHLSVAYSFENTGRKEPRLSLHDLVARNITGQRSYRPVFDHALHHGLFMNFFAGGIAKDSGIYKNGLRQGMWLHRDSTKQLTYKGAYANGLKIKEWKTYDADGKLREFVFYSSRGKVKWRKQFQ
jgi:antitoxin component YwqK of YwqJK toxin-antitoxin module